jgi:hypothetical protein
MSNEGMSSSFKHETVDLRYSIYLVFPPTPFLKHISHAMHTMRHALRSMPLSLATLNSEPLNLGTLIF